jgi:uncharacterized protein YabE (DUF348 family)
MNLVFNSIKVGRYKFAVVAAFAVVSLLGIFSHVSAQANDPAHDGRLITIHDRGEERVILTHAENIRDALSDAHISVVSEDQVEPSLDTSLVATNYTVNIYRARPIVVVDGMIREKIMTAAQTPASIAHAAGLDLRDEDKATMAPSTDIVNDGASTVLNIDRATAFTLSLYGSPKAAYTQAKTVGEMLDSKHITLGSKDSLSVDRNTPLAAGMTVSIWRDGVQTITTDEVIPFPVRQVQDMDHPVGYHEVQTPGTPGKRTVTYQIDMQHGQEISRKEIQSVVLEQPKEQVEVVGAGLPAGSHQDWMAAAGIAESDMGYVSYIVEHEGGWVPCKVQGGAIDCSYSGSMGYGLVQATPGGKMVSAGSDWRTNPITQLKWATSYAVGRYGSWAAAYNHWLSHHNW